MQTWHELVYRQNPKVWAYMSPGKFD